MASVTLANRELRNKATGIDIYVPRHESIPGALGGTVLYNIIVVTRLFYFKTQGKHKESDVVQFMIPQKYSVFEDLYHKLSQKFPSVVFTALPKKALIINDHVINERRRVMEDVLEHIARTPKLACSSLALEFLGAQHLTKDSTPLDEKDAADPERQQTKRADEDVAEDIDLFAAEDKIKEPETGEKGEEGVSENDESDLFSLARTAVIRPAPTSSIFTVDAQDDEEDIGGLFIPAGAVQKKPVTIETEDNSELLNVDDDLDKLLNIASKPKKPPKPTPPSRTPKPVPKPRTRSKPELKPKPAPKPRFEETTGNDDLFKSDEKKTANKAKKDEEELFAPRKGSLRKPSHEEESLDDIFKPSSSKSPFPDDDEDDLFKSTSSKSTDMSADDIASYIQQNTADDQDSLDLF